MNMQARPPVENMLMARRENPGTGTGGAQALVNQMGQRPNMALPTSTPQTGMPQMPNSQQVVTGKDGKKYQIVIDPKVGLQTFIPHREPEGMQQGMQRGRMGRIAQMGQPQGQMQGQQQGGEMMNRLRGLLAARG